MNATEKPFWQPSWNDGNLVHHAIMLTHQHAAGFDVAPIVAVPPVLISLWLTDRYGRPMVRVLERVQGRLLPVCITRIWRGC